MLRSIHFVEVNLHCFMVLYGSRISCSYTNHWLCYVACGNETCIHVVCSYYVTGRCLVVAGQGGLGV